MNDNRFLSHLQLTKKAAGNLIIPNCSSRQTHPLPKWICTDIYQMSSVLPSYNERKFLSTRPLFLVDDSLNDAYSDSRCSAFSTSDYDSSIDEKGGYQV